jgi:hypothetical protein
MSLYLPTEFGEEYWMTSRWLRVGSAVASLPAVLLMGDWNFSGVIVRFSILKGLQRLTQDRLLSLSSGHQFILV